MRTRTTASTSRALYPSARLVSDYLEGGGVIENGEIGETEGRGREEGTTDKRGGEGREVRIGMGRGGSLLSRNSSLIVTLAGEASVDPQRCCAR